MNDTETIERANEMKVHMYMYTHIADALTQTVDTGINTMFTEKERGNARERESARACHTNSKSKH